MSEVAGVVNVVGQWAKDAKQASRLFTTPSLTALTKIFRVEPIGVISKDCLKLDYIGDVTNTMVNLFASYYLQAISMTAQIGDIKILKILDGLNPNRDTDITRLLDSWNIGTESYGDLNEVAASTYKYRFVGTENHRAAQDELLFLGSNGFGLEAKRDKDDGDEDKPNEDPFSVGKVNLNEATNLAVGKQIDVTFKSNDKTLKMPVMIRISFAPLTNGAVTKILTAHGDDITLGERWHKWMAGRITFWRDLVFARDLIAEHKRNLLQDKDGVYKETMNRATANRQVGFMTMNPSLATASNIYVIDSAVARDVERILGGSLTSPRVRDKVFSATYAMLIAVIDPVYERVVIYHRDIAYVTNVSIKELQSNKKGPDIMDIFKSYSLGNAPAF